MSACPLTGIGEDAPEDVDEGVPADIAARRMCFFSLRRDSIKVI